MTFAITPRKGETMSAIVTTTSQTIETVLVCNGAVIETKYHDTMAEALNHVNAYDVISIEFEELDF